MIVRDLTTMVLYKTNNNYYDNIVGTHGTGVDDGLDRCRPPGRSCWAGAVEADG